MTSYPETGLLLMGVAGALTLSSLIAGGLHWAVHDSRRRAAIANLAVRIKAWWVMATLLSAAFLVGDKAVVLLFAFVSFAALREFLTITHTETRHHGALIAVYYLVLPAQYWFIWHSCYWLSMLFVPVCVFLILPILVAVAADTRNFLGRIAETQWAVMICVYCISYVPALLTLGVRKPGGAPGANLSGIAVFLLVIVQAGDIMQYVFGKLFGKHRIIPAISPF